MCQAMRQCMRADHGGSFLQHLKMTLVTSEEILERDGPNELEKPPKPTLLLLFLMQCLGRHGMALDTLRSTHLSPDRWSYSGHSYDIPTHIPTIFCRKVVRCQKVRRFDLAVATWALMLHDACHRLPTWPLLCRGWRASSSSCWWSLQWPLCWWMQLDQRLEIRSPTPQAGEERR